MGAPAPKIHLELSTLGRSKSGSITAGLWLSVGDRSFPGLKWSDFVVVVLGWWVEALQSNDRRVLLRFMDGPYLLRVNRNTPEECSIEGVDGHGKEGRSLFSIAAEFLPFREQVCAVGRQVLAACREKGWESRDIERLGDLLGDRR
jgi:hypothetical protein